MNRESVSLKARYIFSLLFSSIPFYLVVSHAGSIALNSDNSMLDLNSASDINTNNAAESIFRHGASCCDRSC